ncbi:MAG TPA: NADH-quinone oxidoreductase subunit M, partial [Thermopolyspora sp.]
QRVAGGPPAESVKAMPDLSGREKWVMAPLVALILVLGVFPKPVFDVINPAVGHTLANVSITSDPAPTVTGAVAEQKGAGQ